MSHPMSVMHLDKTRIPLPVVTPEPALRTDAAGGGLPGGEQSASWCFARSLSSENMRERMGWKNCANAQLQSLPQQLGVSSERPEVKQLQI